MANINPKKGNLSQKFIGLFIIIEVGAPEQYSA